MYMSIYLCVYIYRYVCVCVFNHTDASNPNLPNKFPSCLPPFHILMSLSHMGIVAPNSSHTFPFAQCHNILKYFKIA